MTNSILLFRSDIVSAGSVIGVIEPVIFETRVNCWVRKQLRITVEITVRPCRVGRVGVQRRKLARSEPFLEEGSLLTITPSSRSEELGTLGTGYLAYSTRTARDSLAVVEFHIFFPTIALKRKGIVAPVRILF